MHQLAFKDPHTPRQLQWQFLGAKDKGQGALTWKESVFISFVIPISIFNFCLNPFFFSIIILGTTKIEFVL